MNAGTIVGVYGDDIGFIESIQSPNPKTLDPIIIGTLTQMLEGLGFKV